MSNSSIEKKVIVFGATGAVGSSLLQILSSKQPTWQVVAVTRRKNDPSLKFPSSVTVVEGDVEDLPRVLELTKDVDIIYCCIGFPRYERKYWSKHWPIVTDNLLQAVVAAGTNGGGKKKQLIFCDNLYAYGFNHDEPKMSTSSPTVSPSLTKSKPAIRSWMRQKFVQHMRDHPQTLAVVGGADFFGPGVTNASFLGDTFTRKLAQGQGPLCLGSANSIHDFCYVPDFANAMYLVSIDPKAAALDHFWICPHAVHDKTIQDIGNDIQALLDRRQASNKGTTSKKTVKIQVFSKTMVTILSPFMGFMAEMREMMDSWTKPYRIDDSEFCTTFGVQATPYEQALKEYVEFYTNLIGEEEEHKKSKK